MNVVIKILFFMDFFIGMRKRITWDQTKVRGHVARLVV